MSTNLYWIPVPKDPPRPRQFSFEVKKAIAQRLWGHDGSLYGDKVTLDQSHLMYVEGLIDAGIEGAPDLFAAIQAHGSIEVWISG